MKGKNKTQKGITLIALIITIVVLLILAVVAINSIQNDGILGHAQNAAGAYNQAVKDEESMLQEYEDYLTAANGEAQEYSIGQEVKVGNESFYVIKDSGKTESKVLLLAKYNIIADKSNANYLTQSSSAGSVPFSSDAYWSDDESVWSDLNKCTIPEGVTSIITIAKEYGELFGVKTGRLLTESEANNLRSSALSVMGSFNYWIATAHGVSGVAADGVCLWTGGYTGGVGDDHFSQASYGVRPVIEISKSKISE